MNAKQQLTQNKSNAVSEQLKTKFVWMYRYFLSAFEKNSKMCTKCMLSTQLTCVFDWYYHRWRREIRRILRSFILLSTHLLVPLVYVCTSSLSAQEKIVNKSFVIEWCKYFVNKPKTRIFECNISKVLKFWYWIIINIGFL